MVIQFVHNAQCRGFVTNGSNCWIISQPDQVSETETMARGSKVLFVATSDATPVIKDGRAVCCVLSRKENEKPLLKHKYTFPTGQQS